MLFLWIEFKVILLNSHALQKSLWYFCWVLKINRDFGKNKYIHIIESFLFRTWCSSSFVQGFFLVPQESYVMFSIQPLHLWGPLPWPWSLSSFTYTVLIVSPSISSPWSIFHSSASLLFLMCSPDPIKSGSPDWTCQRKPTFLLTYSSVPSGFPPFFTHSLALSLESELYFNHYSSRSTGLRHTALMSINTCSMVFRRKVRPKLTGKWPWHF